MPKFFKFITIAIIAALGVMASFLREKIINYVPSEILQIISWSLVTPLLLVCFFYLFFFTKGKFSKHSIEARIKQKQQSKNIQPSLLNKLLMYVGFYTAPLILAVVGTFFILQLFGFVTLYFATQPFEEQAKVTGITCQNIKRYGYGYTKINVLDTNNNKQHTVKLFYNLCEKNPQLAHVIINKAMRLKGRTWALGKIYDTLAILDYPNTAEGTYTELPYEDAVVQRFTNFGR